MDWEVVLRQAVSPVLAAYLVFLALLVTHARGRVRAGRMRRRPGGAGIDPIPFDRAALARHLASTVAGGYPIFLGIILVFYLVLGDRTRSFVAEALLEGSALAVMVIPAFLLLSWVESEVRGRRSGRGSIIQIRGDPKGGTSVDPRQSGFDP